MLKNAYFLAKIGADTAENEQHFAEFLPIGRRVADRSGPWAAGPAAPLSKQRKEVDLQRANHEVRRPLQQKVG